MKYSNALVVYAAFFGFSLSAFGSQVIEDPLITKKSIARNAQPALKEMSPAEKFEAELEKISTILEAELKQNDTQDLIQLRDFFEEFKKVSKDLLEVLKSPNYINFDPIAQVLQGDRKVKEENAIKFLFPNANSNKIMAWLNCLERESYLSGQFCLMDSTGKKSLKTIQVHGPLTFSSKPTDGITVLCFVEAGPSESTPFYHRSVKFSKMAENNDKNLIYLDEKNINSAAGELPLLNSIYACYTKAKSNGLSRFDPLTKFIPHDNIADEAKRQVKMAHQFLKMDYLQKNVNDRIQKPIPDRQNLIEYYISKERATITNDEVRCIEYSPEILNDGMKNPQPVLPVEAKKVHRHKHKSSRTDKEKKEHRHKHKSSRKDKVEKEHRHKHKSSRKTRPEKDENKSLIVVRQAEVEKDATQQSNAALQALLDFKTLEANAEMYALKTNKTKSELIECMTSGYTEKYEQVEQLHLALANLSELYYGAIFNRMDENKKRLESIFMDTLANGQ